jgi:hypothetical protein
MVTLFFDNLTDFHTLKDNIGNRRYMGNLHVEDNDDDDDDDDDDDYDDDNNSLFIS